MRIAIILLCVLLFACNKNEIKARSSIVGKWQYKEIFISPGSRDSWKPVNPAQQTIIEFTADSKFTTFTNSSFYLSNFNRYEVISGNGIRFFNTNNYATFETLFTLNSNLTLTYRCIEGCGDRFKPVP
jgi:hypothetical protein